MGEECKHCKKWKEHCRRFEEHFYWDHVDARKMHFSKSMTGDFSSSMIIPKKFIDHFKGELLETIELKVPSGDKWHVELKKTCDGVVLDCGWKNFVVAHGIQENDTLVFKYDGCSSFLVLMFEQGGCEKAASHCAKKMNPMEDLCAIASSKNSRHSYGSSPRRYKQAPPLTVDQKASGANKDFKEKHARRRLNTKKIYRRKKHFIDSKRNKSLNEQESEVIDGTMTLANEVTLAKWCSPKNFIISRKARLTDAEKIIVLRFAERIQTDRPCFVSIMVPCNTIKRFYITIPTDFAKQYLPRASGRRILLQLPDKEESWPVHCLVQGHAVGFSTGWREFARDNKLKVSDVCLFEMLEAQEDTLMTVYINRIEPMPP